MNNLSIFSPTFADSLAEVLDRSFKPSLNGLVSNSKVPSVDIRELDSAYLMEVDLPGFSETDIDISLKDRVMTLSSINNVDNTEEEKGNYIIKERSVSQFVRRFALPDDIEAEKVSANFENGVLTVSIPKRAETKARKIEIGKN